MAGFYTDAARVAQLEVVACEASAALSCVSLPQAVLVHDAGKKLDMGKACIRFKKLDDLPLDVIGEVAGAVPVKAFVEIAKKAQAKKK